MGKEFNREAVAMLRTVIGAIFIVIYALIIARYSVTEVQNQEVTNALVGLFLNAIVLLIVWGIMAKKLDDKKEE